MNKNLNPLVRSYCLIVFKPMTRSILESMTTKVPLKVMLFSFIFKLISPKLLLQGVLIAEHLLLLVFVVSTLILYLLTNSLAKLELIKLPFIAPESTKVAALSFSWDSTCPCLGVSGRIIWAVSIALSYNVCVSLLILFIMNRSFINGR